MPGKFRKFCVSLMKETCSFRVEATSEQNAIDRCDYPVGFDVDTFHMWIAREDTNKINNNKKDFSN